MSIQDATMATPKYDMDRIIATDVQTFSVPDTIANKSFSFTTTGISTYYNFIAVYSYDGGATWSDTWATTGTFTGITAFPNVVVSLNMQASGFMSVTVSQKALINGGLNFTLTVKVAYMARYDTVSIPNSLNTTSKLLYANKFSYMKIAVQNHFTSSGVMQTIAHNLGYVPACLAFDYVNAVPYLVAFLDGNYDSAGNGTGVRIDATNIYIDSSVNDVIDYKVYYEAQ